MERGKIIVLCGIDGCGKSTIIKKILEKDDKHNRFILHKHPPKEWFEHPGIRAAYLDEEGIPIKDEEEIEFTHNLRKKEEQEILLPQLLDGKNVIFHRYIFSLFAYYRGINKYSLNELTVYFGDILLPDKVIYLKIGIDEFYKRFQYKEQLSYQKNPEYVKRVMQCYDELANKYNWSVINTEKNSVEECVEDVMNIISNVDDNQPLKNINGLNYLH